jgi:hypothetical protein
MVIMEIKRKIHPVLQEYLFLFPVTAIIGPRQVGKTTLAKEIASEKEVIYLDLERATDREKLSEPEFYFAQFEGKSFILDEIQFMPDLFGSLRGIIDRDRKPGKFILLGSASPDIIKGTSETLAGRIGYLELTPFLVSEVDDLQQLWLRGGFPLSYLADSDRSSALWRSNFISTYIQRDLGLLGLQTDVQIMDRFWHMIATAQGNLLNAESFAKSLDISRPTVNRYLNFLEGSFMIRSLRPWFANINKRLVKSPKIYIRDSGLLHSLLGLNSHESLINHIQLGSSWEGFVVEQISNNLPLDVKPWFYRTLQGAESDMILEKNGKVIAALEIKHSSGPKLSKGFRIAMTDTATAKGYLIGNSPDTYKIDPNITVTNLRAFIENILPTL